MGVYNEFGYVGILNENTVLSDLKPAPPPGHPERHWWEPSDPELGPIGLILSTLHKAGAALDISTFTVHQHGEVPTSFLQVPYNHVKKAMANHFITARSKAAQHQRQLNSELEGTDLVAYRLAYSKLDCTYRKISAYLSAGGALSNDLLF